MNLDLSNPCYEVVAGWFSLSGLNPVYTVEERDFLRASEAQGLTRLQIN